MGQKEQSTAQGAMSGAATGAMIGSVVPGVGTGVGAGAGALIGGVSGWFSGKASEDAAAKREKERKEAYAQADAMIQSLRRDSFKRRIEALDRAMAYYQPAANTLSSMGGGTPVPGFEGGQWQGSGESKVAPAAGNTMTGTNLLGGMGK